jgi:TolB protein
LGVAAAYLLSASVAYRGLGAFPPSQAFWTLFAFAIVALASGTVVGTIAAPDRRGRALAVAVLVAFVTPFALVAWVPGIAQPQQHRLPGGIDVVLAAEPDGNLDLYLVPDGDPARTIELTHTSDVRERYPRLSPDGRSLVYAVDAPDGSTDLHMMTLDSRGHPQATQLLLDGPGNLSETSWSPDGRSLLVRSDTEEHAALLLLDVSTGRLRPFLDEAFNPAWSPDGSAIAFGGYRPDHAGNADIMVANADGSDRRLVVDTGYDDFIPVWSPDGSRLAFTSEAHDGDLDVFVVGLDGSDPTILTRDHAGYDESYLWGPKNDILFLSDRSGTEGMFGYLMDPDGSNIRLFIRL